MFDNIFSNDNYHTQSALEINLRVRDREKQQALFAIENGESQSKFSNKVDDSSRTVAKGSMRNAQILHRHLVTEK